MNRHRERVEGGERERVMVVVSYWNLTSNDLDRRHFRMAGGGMLLEEGSAKNSSIS